MYYATTGLVDALLEMAADRDPNEVTVALATRPAGELPDADGEPLVSPEMTLRTAPGQQSLVTER